jgi:hypothetical protein
LGTAGNKMGHAHLTWACAEAATWFLRGNEPGPKSLARREHKHDQGKARSIRAHHLARAVSCMHKRHTAVEVAQCLRTSGSSAGEPGASRDTAGLSLHRTDVKPMMAASVTAVVRRGPLSLSPALGLDTRSGACIGGGGPHQAHVGCPSPAPEAAWRAHDAQPALCGGRYAGTTSWLGRRGSPPWNSAIVTQGMMEPQEVCGAATPRWRPCPESTSAHATGC